MSRLGDLSLGTPISSTEKMVSELREAWKTTNEKSISQISKFNELLKFTNELSDSYIRSIRVIIDISSLLNAYNELLQDLSNGIKELETTMETSIKSEDIIQLKNLTLNNLDNINSIFDKDFDKLTKVISQASNNQEHLKLLQESKDSSTKLQSSVKAVRDVFK